MVVFRNFFGASRGSEIMTSALDLANAAAHLASNPSDIEPLVRDIQEISAKPQALLSKKDEETLFDIYLQIERYLTMSDPLRKFNKDELRSKASQGLHARLESYENQTLTTGRNQMVAA